VARAAVVASTMLLGVVACDLSRITGSVESGVWSAGTAAHEVTVAGEVRTFHVHVPPKRLTRNSVLAGWPLVIVLHGSGADGSDIERATAFDSIADANLFVAAYPDGSRGSFELFPSDWNAGTCCGGAHRDGIDDIAFIKAMIASVSSKLSIDAHRIYVAGFSAGGRMAYHVGCRMSTTIAAIAVASGSLVDDACAPGVGVPLIATHGTSDPEVDYGEEAPPPPRSPTPAAAELPPAVQFWVALGKCTSGKVTPLTAHVAQAAFTACPGTEIQFYRIESGTHGWPGGAAEPGSLPPMNEIRFSALAWQFFNRKTR
jgi:polyhydroxybutyrate depolymerase